MIIGDILLALGVVGAVGLLAGVLLALFSHFFGVPVDQKEKQIRENLPGINCGACGFKGCDDYAAALAAGGVKPNLCIPGGETVSSAVAQILGVQTEEVENKLAFVHCNGNCEATSKKMIYEGVQTCRAAVAVYGGPNTCTFGCMGFGDCAVACPADAICIEDGIAHVDPSRCLGCGLCTTVCPKHIISMLPQGAKAAVMCNSHDKGAVARKLCQNACIGCKKCEKGCNEGAIVVKNDLAIIDYSRCSHCRSCTELCPTGAIKAILFSDSADTQSQAD